MKENGVRNIKKDLLTAGITLLILVLVVIGAGFGIDRLIHPGRKTGETDPSKETNGTEKTEVVSESETPRRAILDDEGNYVCKEQVSTYLFLGIDVTGPVKKNEGYINSGQADTQLVLVLDDEAKTRQMLQLNRDSMVEMPVLGVMGEEVGYKKQQLALAHAYGDGMEGSCENNVKTVSRLLGNQKIDGYYALNMDGIGVITEAIGGVEVTLESDYSAVDPEMVKGATMVLSGDRALRYLRSRKDVDDGTNQARMSRQRVFLNALQKKLGTVDSKTALIAFDEVQDYRVTDMGSKSMLTLLEKLKTYEDLGTKTIEGENTVDSEGHFCYNLDEESLTDVIMQLFYKVAE